MRFKIKERIRNDESKFYTTEVFIFPFWIEQGGNILNGGRDEWDSYKDAFSAIDEYFKGQVKEVKTYKINL